MPRRTRGTASFSVYVVELREEARVKAPIPEGGGGPCVYVGETALTPEQRFARHMEGGRVAAAIVRDYGVRLNTELATRGPFLTRANAAKAEKALGDSLRRRGFTVFGGTGKTMMRDALADRL